MAENMIENPGRSAKSRRGMRGAKKAPTGAQTTLWERSAE